jgi:VanZ family protein
MVVRTPLPPGIEHAVAYAGSAALLTLAYPARAAWTIAAWLLAYSGALELLQSLSPGRHPGLAGAVWSGAGAALGAVLVYLARATRPAGKA